MAGCLFSRLDSRDTTTSGGKNASSLIYVEAENRIFCAWVDYGNTPNGPTDIQFAKYDPVTHTADSEVTILTDSPRNGAVRAIDMIRLSDGRLIVVWYNSTADDDVENAIFASESADNGATWSAAVPLPSDAAAETKNTFPIGMCNDGSDNIHLLASGLSSPAGLGDVIAFARTGVDTWTEGAKIYDGTANHATIPSWDVTQTQQMHHSMFMSSTLVGCIVGFRSKNSANNNQRVSCLYTTDAWATATAVDLDTAASNYAGVVQGVRLSTGRIIVCWSDPDTGDLPIFAYSDDEGVTWTLVGTPTEISDAMTLYGVSDLNESYDNSLTVDTRDNLVWCCDTGSASIPSHHLTFRSVDPTSLGGWVTVGDCTHTSSDAFNTVPCGRVIIVGADAHRLTGMNRTTHVTLEFIFVEDAVPGDEPEEPPVVPPSESGADDNNLLFRIDLSEGRGWSLHTIGPSCFMGWDEGDKETGREVGIILAGNPNMDPAIQDPELIWGWRRIETGENNGFGWRTYVDAASDDQQVRLDPMRMLVRSKVWTPEQGGSGERFLFRQVLLTWVFDAEPGQVCPVQVWIDREKLNRVIELPTTHGLKRDEWFSLPTTANVGECIQLVCDETSNYDVKFDVMGASYMRKKRRS